MGTAQRWVIRSEQHLSPLSRQKHNKMARTYQIKGGIKTLVPTERQMAKLEKAKLVEPHADASGRQAGFSHTPLWAIVALKRNWDAYSSIERNKILKDGVQTKAYALLRAYEIYLEHEEEKKNGIKSKKSKEITDKKFKYNLNKLMKEWSVDMEIEKSVMFDARGNFLGIAFGVTDHVDSNYQKGILVGGTSMHNHPTSPNRPLGLPFSVPDIQSFWGEGAARYIVTTREGTYEMKTEGRLKFKFKDIEEYATAWASRKRVMYATREKVGIPESHPRFQRLWFKEMHDSLNAFSKKHGFEYTFKPKKGYENLTDINAIGKPLPRSIFKNPSLLIK